MAEELRGRTATVLTAGLMTLQGGGMAPAGAVARYAGVTATVAGAGVLGTAVCALLAAEARRTHRAGAATERRDRADRHMTGG